MSYKGDSETQKISLTRKVSYKKDPFVVFERIKKHLATGEFIKRMLSDAPIQNDSDNEVCLFIEIHSIGFQIWIVT